MNRQKIILFIQHAASLGGSCASLLYQMQCLNKSRYQPILALINDSEQVKDYYKKAGFDPIIWPRITFWNHTTADNRSLYKPSTWLYLIRLVRSWKIGKQRTLELINLVKPDLVHLNSAVLSASAKALKQANIPFVWHIREQPPREFLGIRTGIIRRLMLKCPDELIFISEAGRKAWLNNLRGEVIYNFVDFEYFDRTLDREATRQKLNLPLKASIILYFGGLREIKGIVPLIKSLKKLNKALPNVYCLMPDCVYHPPDYFLLNMVRKILPFFGYGTLGQRVMKIIKKNNLTNCCLLTEFNDNAPSLIACADVVVFPAIEPHFARPVIEAGAMAKPVVASDLAGTCELVQNGITGILVPPKNPEKLAAALLSILTDKTLAKNMGENGYSQAKKKFSAQENIEMITNIYERILHE